jgi:hypothetical protein
VETLEEKSPKENNNKEIRNPEREVGLAKKVKVNYIFQKRQVGLVGKFHW